MEGPTVDTHLQAQIQDMCTQRHIMAPSSVGRAAAYLQLSDHFDETIGTSGIAGPLLMEFTQQVFCCAGLDCYPPAQVG